jgi:outer membrane lipoprotein SlyB
MIIEPKQQEGGLSRDDRFYRILGTTAGGAMFGGAVASAVGGMVVVGAIAGGLLGLAISSAATARMPSHVGG